MDVGDVALLTIVQWAVTLVGQQVRKTENGVQRRAELVAHCREKLILELTAALNFLFSKKDGMRELFNLSFGSLKLGGAFPDALLQPIAYHSQSVLALLDLGLHLIESIGKDNQLGQDA